MLLHLQGDKTTKSAKQKRSQAQSILAVSDSEDDDDPKEMSRLHRQVVKEAHWSVEDYPINEEKKLQRLGTRGGNVYMYMYTSFVSCRLL